MASPGLNPDLARAEEVARKFTGGCIGCGAAECSGCWSPLTTQEAQTAAPLAKQAGPEHGTGRRYQRGCRCRRCRAANTQQHRELRRSRQQAGQADPSLIPHGEGGYTNWGCRCDTCKAANSERLRRRYTPALPTPDSERTTRD